MGLLEGKRIVVTGVLTDASIAFGVAKLALEEGADVILTGAGRGLSLTERTARKLSPVPKVFELDVSEPSHLETVRAAVADEWDRVDGVLHAIGYAPPVCLGGTFMEAQWEDVGVALNISAYSLKALADAFVPLMTDGGSIVGLDFDARWRGRPTTGWAWPRPRWSRRRATCRASSGPSGVRVNLVAAGPVRTMAAKSIPGFSAFEDVWAVRAPLGWDINDSRPVAKACVALLSDWFPMTTGSMVWVDGGFHAIGA